MKAGRGGALIKRSSTINLTHSGSLQQLKLERQKCELFRTTINLEDADYQPQQQLQQTTNLSSKVKNRASTTSASGSASNRAIDFLATNFGLGSASSSANPGAPAGGGGRGKSVVANLVANCKNLEFQAIVNNNNSGSSTSSNQADISRHLAAQNDKDNSNNLHLQQARQSGNIKAKNVVHFAASSSNINNSNSKSLPNSSATNLPVSNQSRHQQDEAATLTTNNPLISSASNVNKSHDDYSIRGSNQQPNHYRNFKMPQAFQHQQHPHIQNLNTTTTNQQQLQHQQNHNHRLNRSRQANSNDSSSLVLSKHQPMQSRSIIEASHNAYFRQQTIMSYEGTCCCP